MKKKFLICCILGLPSFVIAQSSVENGQNEMLYANKGVIHVNHNEMSSSISEKAFQQQNLNASKNQNRSISFISVNKNSNPQLPSSVNESNAVLSSDKRQTGRKEEIYSSVEKK